MALDQPHQTPAVASVFFERREFQRILNLYGRMVSAGEWRDYAIDAQAEAARCSARPPKRRSTASSRPGPGGAPGGLVGDRQGGVILKRRGHDLEQVLRVFDKGRFKVVDEVQQGVRPNKSPGGHPAGLLS